MNKDTFSFGEQNVSKTLPSAIKEVKEAVQTNGQTIQSTNAFDASQTYNNAGFNADSSNANVKSNAMVRTLTNNGPAGHNMASTKDTSDNKYFGDSNYIYNFNNTSNDGLYNDKAANAFVPGIVIAFGVLALIGILIICLLNFYIK